MTTTKKFAKSTNVKITVKGGKRVLDRCDKGASNVKILELLDDGVKVHWLSNYNTNGDFATELMTFRLIDGVYAEDQGDTKERNDRRIERGLKPIEPELEDTIEPERTLIGQGYYAHSARYGNIEYPKIYLIDGKAYAEHYEGYVSSGCVSPITGYVQVNCDRTKKVFREVYCNRHNKYINPETIEAGLTVWIVREMYNNKYSFAEGTIVHKNNDSICVLVGGKYIDTEVYSDQVFYTKDEALSTYKMNSDNSIVNMKREIKHMEEGIGYIEKEQKELGL